MGEDKVVQVVPKRNSSRPVSPCFFLFGGLQSWFKVSARAPDANRCCLANPSERERERLPYAITLVLVSVEVRFATDAWFAS